MKKVLKNIFKSISVACIIVVILCTIFYGIYAEMLNKYVQIENGELIVNKDGFMNTRVSVFEGGSEEDCRNYVVYSLNILPATIVFSTMLHLLLFSIIIGVIIGIAISMDEFSKKRMLITYIGTYLSVLALLLLMERVSLVTWNVSNGFGVAFEFLLIYVLLLGCSFVGKKIYRKRQSKLMNKQLEVK